MAPTGRDRYRGLPKAITTALDNESDRGVALIVGSYLEEILAFLISSSCVSDGLAKKLLGTRCPAGSFDAKIVLTEALGLVHEEDARALRVVQCVRNKAAHFNAQGNGGIEVEFAWSAYSGKVAPFASSLGVSVSGLDDAEVRRAFVASSRLLAMKLLSGAMEIQRPEAPMSFRERADQAQEQLRGTQLGEMLAEAKRQAKLGNPAPGEELSDFVRWFLENRRGQ